MGIIVHIGQMKSGTTYLQNILSQNRKDLNRDGWIYPGRLLNHQHACYGLCGPDIAWNVKENKFVTLAKLLEDEIKFRKDM